MKLTQNLEEIQKSAMPNFKFPLEAKGIGKLISDLLPYLFAAAGLLLLLYLIYGGLSLMLSRGDPKAIQSARDKITGALVGFIIVFAAYWIVQIVGTIFGIEAIKETFIPK